MVLALLCWSLFQVHRCHGAGPIMCGRCFSSIVLSWCWPYYVWSLFQFHRSLMVLALLCVVVVSVPSYSHGAGPIMCGRCFSSIVLSWCWPYYVWSLFQFHRTLMVLALLCWSLFQVHRCHGAGPIMCGRCFSSIVLSWCWPYYVWSLFQFHRSLMVLALLCVVVVSAPSYSHGAGPIMCGRCFSSIVLSWCWPYYVWSLFQFHRTLMVLALLCVVVVSVPSFSHGAGPIMCGRCFSSIVLSWCWPYYVWSLFQFHRSLMVLALLCVVVVSVPSYPHGAGPPMLVSHRCWPYYVWSLFQFHRTLMVLALLCVVVVSVPSFSHGAGPIMCGRCFSSIVLSWCWPYYVWSLFQFHRSLMVLALLCVVVVSVPSYSHGAGPIMCGRCFSSIVLSWCWPYYMCSLFQLHRTLMVLALLCVVVVSVPSYSHGAGPIMCGRCFSSIVLSWCWPYYVWSLFQFHRSLMVLALLYVFIVSVASYPHGAGPIMCGRCFSSIVLSWCWPYYVWSLFQFHRSLMVLALLYVFIVSVASYPHGAGPIMCGRCFSSIVLSWCWPYYVWSLFQFHRSLIGAGPIICVHCFSCIVPSWCWPYYVWLLFQLHRTLMVLALLCVVVVSVPSFSHSAGPIMCGRCFSSIVFSHSAGAIICGHCFSSIVLSWCWPYYVWSLFQFHRSLIVLALLYVFIVSVASYPHGAGPIMCGRCFSCIVLSWCWPYYMFSLFQLHRTLVVLALLYVVVVSVASYPRVSVPSYSHGAGPIMCGRCFSSIVLSWCWPYYVWLLFQLHRTLMVLALLCVVVVSVPSFSHSAGPIMCGRCFSSIVLS